jgi:nucleotide-binding universal stress UspA family protein
MKLERILVPTDYSPHATRALELALSFAEHTGAALDLLHVYQVPTDLYPYSLYITDEHLKQIEERKEDQMSKLCDKTRARGAKVEGSVVLGETHDVIPRIAKERDADLIIMGTRGNSGLAHVLLGSTAERTVRLAPCPVISVPEPKEART